MNHCHLFLWRTKLTELKPEQFEAFDAQPNKTLASRAQLTVIVTFAMTAHRAQRQTQQNVHIDSGSFLVLGNLGVAI